MNRKMELEARSENLYTLLDSLEEALKAVGCPQETVLAVAISAEEIFTNIVSYAYPGGTGMVTAELYTEDGRAKIRFTDAGTPFNPLTEKKPDLGAAAEEREPGGLGIYLVRAMMDQVEYSREDGRNHLTMIKNW